MKKLLDNLKNLSKKDIIILSSILLLIVILLLTLMFGKINSSGSEDFDNNPNQETKNEENISTTPKVSIVDVNSKSRPYAVMINNQVTARNYQSGLTDAYIVYELIAEGGVTRYIALFKDKNTERIGSVRSSRHYFLDYALENDAIYVHWGWSPQAKKDISALGINNINGLSDSAFYRDQELLNNGVALEHTGFTTMENLKRSASNRNYRQESDKKLLLNYVVGDVDLSEKEDAKQAKKVVIDYSGYVEDKYVYDEENKYYLRYVNDKENVDYATKKQLHFKNIITYQVYNATISGDHKGRQQFDNIGSGEGYYITNGYAVKIKWSKSSREAQTVYSYMDGKEIDVSDGNTFIQIQPKGQNLVIE